MRNLHESGRKLRDLLNINNDSDFHKFFIQHAIEQYISFCKRKNCKLGSVLILGGWEKEAKIFPKYPFSEIVLSGILDPSGKMKEIILSDPRVSYKKENIENLSAKNESFDLVFCKESLHHLSRPVLGLYEMLRVCKKAAVFIEPNETFLGNLLEKIGLSSVYEKNQQGNLRGRDNYVYRWSKRDLAKLLRSYYLESGWELYLTTCWLSNRPKVARSGFRKLFLFFGWFANLFPFIRGNYLSAFILPGKDKPVNFK